MEEEKYYYIRDRENKPLITVCLIELGGKIGRGIAICSDLDQPCKKAGRAIARTRAIFALHTATNSCKMGRWDFDNVSIAGKEFVDRNIRHIGLFKSYYNPTLTNYEQKLFKNKNHNNIV